MRVPTFGRVYVRIHVSHRCCCVRQTLLFALLAAGVALCLASAVESPESQDQLLSPVVEEGDQAAGDLDSAESHYKPYYKSVVMCLHVPHKIGHKCLQKRRLT